ncbi:MAG: hypothetical protein GY851_29085 [bacterium]|nr:hypothetical protein [bacterium]
MKKPTAKQLRKRLDKLFRAAVRHPKGPIRIGELRDMVAELEGNAPAYNGV